MRDVVVCLCGCGAKQAHECSPAVNPAQCCIADITAAGTLLGHQDKAGASWQPEQYINWQGPTTKAAGKACCRHGDRPAGLCLLMLSMKPPIVAAAELSF